MGTLEIGDTRVNEALRCAAEAAVDVVKTVLEAHGLRYAGVAVVAEISRDVDPVRTGCWLCARDGSVLSAVQETLVKAMKRVEEQAPAVPKPQKEMN